MDIEKVRLAGKIAGTALKEGGALIKVGASVEEVTKKVEDTIHSMGGKLAFPVCMSFNHVAAHEIPLPNDPRMFTENDIVKLDIGVHVDGWVADNAKTIDLTGNYTELVQASRDALNNAIALIKPGVQLREIGAVIQKTITDAGFVPIKNLSGHSIEQWVVHAGVTIPNYDNGDTTTLKEGMQIAIEPFSTLGDGLVIEGKGGGIYKIEKLKPVRSPQVKKVLQFLHEEYQSLPFSRRATNLPMRDFAFTQLEKEGILYQYPALVERARGIVAQSEHAMIVTKNGVEVITQVD